MWQPRKWIWVIGVGHWLGLSIACLASAAATGDPEAAVVFWVGSTTNMAMAYYLGGWIAGAAHHEQS